METFLFLLEFCVVCAFLVSPSSQAQLPNVLFLVADDLRPVLGCYGEANARTANLDNLASKSMLFEQAYANQALCGPSRTSFLTGRRPDTTRTYDLKTYWRDEAGNFTTLPQHFKENGYITQNVGKIFHPRKSSNYNDDSPYSWTNTPYHPSTQQYKNAKVCPNPDGSLGMNIVCPVELDKMPEKTLPDIQTADFAVDFLGKVSKTQPFFLAVGFHKPHMPYKYPKEYLDLFPLSEFGLAPNNTYPPRMPLVAWHPWNDLRQRDDFKALNVPYPFGPIPEHYQRVLRQNYYAATSFMDTQVGRVLEALESNGFADNTIISFHGDHGFSLGERQEWAKHSVTDDATRVPYMMYVPGVTYQKTESEQQLFPFIDPFAYYLNSSLDTEASASEDPEVPIVGKRSYSANSGLRTAAFAELVDLFPTLADAAGIPVPSTCPLNPFKTKLCTEGTSLMPLIKNTAGIKSNNEGDIDLKRDNLNEFFETRSDSLSIPELSKEWKPLAEDCVNITISSSVLGTGDPSWKKVVFNQFPRPSVMPGPDSDSPRLKEIKIMGYAMETLQYHYVEWVGFDPKTFTVDWEDIYARELYVKDFDPFQVLNVAQDERCFPLVLSLSQTLHKGWREFLL